MSSKFIQMLSPVGKLTLVACDSGLSAVLWPVEKAGRVKISNLEQDDSHKVLQATRIQLTEYFAGKRREFDLPLAPIGTDFQLRVWQELREIPFGETRSYAEVARAIGNEKASRAVGTANGRNPLSIVVPCHRVIGQSGALTGFAGGLEAKSILLNIEKREVSHSLDR